MLSSSMNRTSCLFASLGDKELFSSANILQIADVIRQVNGDRAFSQRIWPDLCCNLKKIVNKI